MGYLNKVRKWIYKLAGDNGIYIKSDGSLRKIGTARVFEDVVGDLLGKKLTATAGRVDYDWDENAMKFQSNGDITNSADRVSLNVQVPHSADINDPYAKMHLHWFQQTAVKFTFEMRYRLQNNGNDKTSAWTTITVETGGASDGFDYTSGTLNQLTWFPEFDYTDMNISSTYQVQLARTDSNSGDALVYFADAHFAIDSDGSMSEWHKDS